MGLAAAGDLFSLSGGNGNVLFFLSFFASQETDKNSLKNVPVQVWKTLPIHNLDVQHERSAA